MPKKKEPHVQSCLLTCGLALSVLPVHFHHITCGLLFLVNNQYVWLVGQQLLFLCETGSVTGLLVLICVSKVVCDYVLDGVLGHLCRMCNLGHVSWGRLLSLWTCCLGLLTIIRASVYIGLF